MSNTAESECLFCKIVAGEIDGDLVFESDAVIGFRDINPQAPIHVLFVPKIHIATLNDCDATHAEIVGELLLAAASYAKSAGVDDDGYRVVMNCNALAGQTVFHIHLHLLAGRRIGWPPG